MIRKFKITEHFYKENLGAEANDKRECHRRHLEIWREKKKPSSRAYVWISNQSL